MGFLNAVFHPNYEINGYIYLTFTERGDSNCQLGVETGPRTRCSRFIYSNGAVDLTTEEVFFETGRQNIAQHSGGNMAFGNDGMLWIALGDMGSKSLGQNKWQLKSSLLRLTPDGDIPPDNPFVGDSNSERCNETGEASSPDKVCQEIWAYGTCDVCLFSVFARSANASVTVKFATYDQTSVSRSSTVSLQEHATRSRLQWTPTMRTKSGSTFLTSRTTLGRRLANQEPTLLVPTMAGTSQQEMLPCLLACIGCSKITESFAFAGIFAKALATTLVRRHIRIFVCLRACVFACLLACCRMSSVLTLLKLRFLQVTNHVH